MKKERTDSLEYIAKKHKQEQEEYLKAGVVKRVALYEKQCFWADRDWGNYPEPERHNPDRCIEPERDTPTHSIIEHER